MCNSQSKNERTQKTPIYYLHVLQCTSNITYKQQNQQRSTWLIIGKKIRIALFIVACKKKSEENIKELRVSCGKNSNLPPCLCQLRIQAKDFFAPCTVCMYHSMVLLWRQESSASFWWWRKVGLKAGTRARARHVRRRRLGRARLLVMAFFPLATIYPMLYCYTGKSLDG